MNEWFCDDCGHFIAVDFSARSGVRYYDDWLERRELKDLADMVGRAKVKKALEILRRKPYVPSAEERTLPLF